MGLNLLYINGGFRLREPLATVVVHWGTYSLHCDAVYCPLAQRRTLAPLHRGLPPSCTVMRFLFFGPSAGDGGGYAPLHFCCFLLFFWSACEGNAPMHFSLVCVRVCVYFLFLV